MATDTITDANNAIKPNATIATKIGLIVPIKETTIKNFVTRLGMLDDRDIIPKQVPKSTIVAVSAVVEKFLTFIVAKTTENMEGNAFNVDHVLNPITSSLDKASDLAILAPFLSEVKENALKSDKKSTKSKSTKSKNSVPQENITVDDDADEEDASPTNDEQLIEDQLDEDGKKKKELPSLAKCSFSCSNQISKQIKTLKENIRVSSEAVEVVQLFLDGFYQKMVHGAYWIAQNNGRKTISKNDVIVSLKIMLPQAFAPQILDHVESISSKFQEIEASKKENDHNDDASKSKTEKPAKKAKVAKKSAASDNQNSDDDIKPKAVKKETIAKAVNKKKVSPVKIAVS